MNKRKLLYVFVSIVLLLSISFAADDDLPIGLKDDGTGSIAVEIYSQ